MFLLIVSIMINCINAQVAAPTQKTSSELGNKNNQNSIENKIGNTLKEEYTDSDGNVKSRSYRYGFQYKDNFKTAKPSGEVLKESYTKESGDQSARSYRYGWQYKPKEEAAEAPIKLKAQKWNAPLENPGENAGAGAATHSDSASSSSSAPSSSASSSSAPANPLAPSADDIKRKDADILNRMKDLIKERQQLKAGKN
jgi:hypothetical protein